jgi:hypothetical protein
MKYLIQLILLIFSFSSTTFLFAQNKSTDQLVEEFLGTSKYENCIIDNPGLIEYLKIKSTEGYEIETVSKEKFSSYKELPKVLYLKKEISANQFSKATKSPDFNFLNYSFPTIEEGAFRLSKNERSVIVIYSSQNINRKVRNIKSISNK